MCTVRARRFCSRSVPTVSVRRIERRKGVQAVRSVESASSVRVCCVQACRPLPSASRPGAEVSYARIDLTKTRPAPSASNPKQPISKAGIEAAWHKIRKAAQIDDVRMHDLLHTVGTYAGQTGANAFLVRDLLRHKNLAMTGRYVNRADSPVRTLSDQVGERIAAAMAGKPAAEVVPLKAVKP
ncbi:MAG: tyrosine-type recombinase/integrase [Xanthobacteraceae bacterium]